MSKVMQILSNMVFHRVMFENIAYDLNFDDEIVFYADNTIYLIFQDNS